MDSDNEIRELTIKATAENIASVTEFVDELLEELECSVKIQTSIDIAIDELFGNIVHYAYKPNIGEVTILTEVIDEPLAVVITFIDKGIPYNPLTEPDPDITLSADERKVGGLGIYMVKKMMDSISYEHKDGKNILRIQKNI